MDASPQDIERLMMSANLHRLRGEVNEAEALVRAVLQRYPQDAFALEFLGDLLFQKGDVAGAEAAFRAVLQDNPGRAAVEEKLARVILSATPVSITSASGTPLRTDRSPFTVLILSLMLPGAGHYYMGDKVKGLLLSAGTFLLMFATVPMVFSALKPVMSTVSTGLSGTGLEEGGNLQMPSTPTSIGWQMTLISVLMIALYAYACFDGFTTARRIYRPK